MASYTGHDTTGRAYATVNATKAGDVIIADAGFVSDVNGQDGHCIAPASEVTVQDDNDGHGLYVACAHGKHFLDGQIETADTGVDFYMGLYPKT